MASVRYVAKERAARRDKVSFEVMGGAPSPSTGTAPRTLHAGEGGVDVLDLVTPERAQGSLPGPAGDDVIRAEGHLA
jgi:hypothetical protein